MTIGELARAAGTQVETIRFYEREGLLPAPERSGGNYRIYGGAHAERLSFIRRCRSLDIAIDEIRVLLRFKDAPAENCREVNEVLDEHIAHVAARIGELRQLERHLRALRRLCRQVQDAGHCGILAGLARPAGRGRGPAAARATDHVRGTHRARPMRRSAVRLRGAPPLR